MKHSYLIIIVCIAACLYGCSEHVYAPALYHQDIAYMPKPASFSKEKTATYVSAGLGVGFDPTYNNTLESGQLNLSQGYAFNGANFAWGVFGVAGDYEKNADIDGNYVDFKDKFFGAAGARISANLFTTYPKMEWRYLGFEAAYSHEFGDYANYRKQVVNNPDYIVDARTELVSAGLTTEFVFHGRNTNITHGIRGYLGTTFGSNILNDPRNDNQSDFNTRLMRSLVPRASYFISVKHFFGVAEIGNVFSIRAGVKF
jgi:hypothetical protein